MNQKILKFNTSETQKRKDLYYFFRKEYLTFKKNFENIVLTKPSIPKVLLHGNAHVENVVINKKGVGLVDFDRSCVGPYSFDIIRFLSSLYLKQKKNEGHFLPQNVLNEFKNAYIFGFKNPRFKGKSYKKNIKVRKWQKSTEAYIHSKKKWGKKLFEKPISLQDKKVLHLIWGYMRSRNEEDLLFKYKIDRIGEAEGTFGKKRYLVHLVPLNKDKDSILLDIKEVYQDEDTILFYNPYKHHGFRMIEACRHYSSKLESRLGYTDYQGQQYWVRRIQPFQMKFEEELNTSDLINLVHIVGLQLGQAHRKNLFSKTKTHLIHHFEVYFDDWVKLAQKLVHMTIKDFQNEERVQKAA